MNKIMPHNLSTIKTSKIKSFNYFFWIGIVVIFLSSFNCSFITNKTNKKPQIDTIIAVMVMDFTDDTRIYNPPHYWVFSIIADTIFSEEFISNNISFDKKFSMNKRKIPFAIIMDSAIVYIDKVEDNIVYRFNANHYHLGLPRIGFQTSYYSFFGTSLLYPASPIRLDSNLKLKYVEYIWGKGQIFLNGAPIDSILKLKPDSLLLEKKIISKLHPIFGNIIDIDSMFFIKGSYQDLNSIERRIGFE